MNKGFRDIYKMLEEEYRFKVQIPTCSQLEKEKGKESDNEDTTSKNALTTEQTAQTRLVTKVK